MRIPRDSEDDEALPNMTPLLDMMFILIIFFLATSRFQQEERDETIQLVKSKSTLPIATTQQLFVINIDREGQRIVDGQVYNLQELEEMIRTRKKKDNNLEVVVRPDERSMVRFLSETTEICHRLGVKTPKISYEVVGN